MATEVTNLIAPSGRSRSLSKVNSGIHLKNLSDVVTGARSRAPSIATIYGVIDDCDAAPPAKELQSHLGRIFLAGAGFLADGYDLFMINLVLRMLRDEYPQHTFQHKFEGIVASSALCGSILGQLVSGVLADIIGRKVIFVTTALLITIGSLGSATCIDTPSFNIYLQIAIFRFILGFGVGGEYPLAATITSESTSAASRGKLMVSVFSMQGLGAILSSFTAICCLLSGYSVNFSRRFVMAFGSLPVLAVFPWRLRMHETEAFSRIQLGRSVGRAESTTHTQTSSSEAKKIIPSLSNSHNNGHMKELTSAFNYCKWHVVGTAFSWFLLDITFYANGLFNHVIIQAVQGKATTALEDAKYSGILALISLPGYYLTYKYIDSIGRKHIQCLGFALLSLLFASLYATSDWLHSGNNVLEKYGYLSLYSFTFLFSNFGPNTTSFVIPGEIYPPEIRATIHGISAASGKLGAFIAAYAFPYLQIEQSMIVCSFISFIGLCVTYLFTPTYGEKQLENIDMQYLALDHQCLRPSKNDIDAFYAKRDETDAKVLHVLDKELDEIYENYRGNADTAARVE